MNTNLSNSGGAEVWGTDLHASFEVIDTCNLACAGCYSASLDKKDAEVFAVFNAEKAEHRLTLNDIQGGICRLQGVGVKLLNIEGGEPTLRGDLLEIIDAVRAAEIKSLLSTHGMYLLKAPRKQKSDAPILAEQLIGKLDCLCLSLDGSSEEINDSIRVTHVAGEASGHFQSVMRFLHWYKLAKAKNPNIYTLKINTVVSRQNMHEVSSLAHTLKDALPTDGSVHWKIIQFQPRGAGKEHKEDLKISSDEFMSVTEKAKEYAGNALKITTRTYDGKEYPYMIITYNGTAMYPQGEEHIPMVSNGERVNILRNDFSAQLNAFFDENPDFLNGNKALNSYGLLSQ